jgi:hypothetical protein
MGVEELPIVTNLLRRNYRTEPVEGSNDYDWELTGKRHFVDLLPKSKIRVRNTGTGRWERNLRNRKRTPSLAKTTNF